MSHKGDEMEKKGNVWKSGFTQVPNVYFKTIPFYIDTRSALLIVIIYQTFGYDRPCHRMTTSFLMNATGKSKSQVIRALNILEEQNIIINYKDKEFKNNVWGLNENYSQWDGYEEIKQKLLIAKNTDNDFDEIDKIVKEIEKAKSG